MTLPPVRAPLCAPSPRTCADAENALPTQQALPERAPAAAAKSARPLGDARQAGASPEYWRTPGRAPAPSRSASVVASPSARHVFPPGAPLDDGDENVLPALALPALAAHAPSASGCMAGAPPAGLAAAALPGRAPGAPHRHGRPRDGATLRVAIRNNRLRAVPPGVPGPRIACRARAAAHAAAPQPYFRYVFSHPL